MIRSFAEHEKRRVADLEGLWDFEFLGERVADSVDVRTITYNDSVAVPGSFDATPRYAGIRGLAAYRKKVFLCDTRRHRIRLNGVHHWCRVFLVQDDVTTHLIDHSGGFTVFSADSTSHDPGYAEIVVLTDNRFNYERCPTHLDYFDWYHYGGITRGADLSRLGSCWIESVRIETLDFRSRRVSIRVECRGDATAPGEEETLTIRIDGNDIFSSEVTFTDGVAVIETDFLLTDATLWSPESPELHFAHCTLGMDDLVERFGIRQIRVDGPDIKINDQPVTLLGFCRHEAHPQFGCGLPKSLHVEDMQLIEEMGCNFVRGSHYPQDPAFLDLCDERGICVWDEATGWQHTTEHLNDPNFIQAQKNNIGEMIAVSANHPSVIIWGIQNESHSEDPANRNAYKTLIEEIRSLDPNRPVTYASNHWPNDALHDLIDIISINMYPGWYDGEIDEIPEKLDTIVDHIDTSDSKDKPIIISEIGAGAVPGTRDRNKTRWSEEYQAKLLDVVIEHLFETRARVCGISVWQFCDCRTSEQVGRILGRPRGFNNKGVVDEYRRPKLAFDVVKRRFGAIDQ